MYVGQKGTVVYFVEYWRTVSSCKFEVLIVYISWTVQLKKLLQCCYITYDWDS